MALFANNACKAWCDINMTGTAVINDDFGVSSVSDHSTGDNTINFDTNMGNANFCVTGCSENWETTNGDSYTVVSGMAGSGTRAVGSYRFRCIRLRFDTGNIPQFKDSTHASFSFFGD